MTNNIDETKDQYFRIGQVERKVLRMVWNTLAIVGWVGLLCALTQLAM